jgi:hypothetical protein
LLLKTLPEGLGGSVSSLIQAIMILIGSMKMGYLKEIVVW